MTLLKRILLCLLIIIIDSLIFFIPITAIIFCIILIIRPLWFKQFINKIYENKFT